LEPISGIQAVESGGAMPGDSRLNFRLVSHRPKVTKTVSTPQAGKSIL